MIIYLDLFWDNEIEYCDILKCSLVFTKIKSLEFHDLQKHIDELVLKIQRD